MEQRMGVGDSEGVPMCVWVWDNRFQLWYPHRSAHTHTHQSYTNKHIDIIDMPVLVTINFERRSRCSFLFHTYSKLKNRVATHESQTQKMKILRVDLVLVIGILVIAFSFFFTYIVWRTIQIFEKKELLKINLWLRSIVFVQTNDLWVSVLFDRRVCRVKNVQVSLHKYQITLFYAHILIEERKEKVIFIFNTTTISQMRSASTSIVGVVFLLLSI